MAKARKEVEIAVRLGNRSAAVQEVLSTLASRGLSVLAYCTYTEQDDLVMLLVTNDALKAKDMLQSAGRSCKANSVVVVGAPHELGSTAAIGAHLGSSGVEILYSYTSRLAGAQSIAVFKTTNDDHAIQALEICPQARAAA
ncbi:MAG TPA: hypothetical protein VMV72_10340 [Verrucomicrobiae bacterium]|nr:hypothetical protein [Verrucomicrobiae bacterium]